MTVPIDGHTSIWSDLRVYFNIIYYINNIAIFCFCKGFFQSSVAKSINFSLCCCTINNNVTIFI